MSGQNPQARAIEELEQFGLREYEAKCFVSLTKITAGTAREVSEHIDVPRTRVYEAVRSLEADGLVEIQHSSPQRFRAIPISEALEVLERRHKSRMESLEQSLRQIRKSNNGGNSQQNPEIWSLSGTDTITTRAKRLVDDAQSEVLLLLGDRQALSGSVHEKLLGAVDRGVDVVVGAGSEPLRAQVSESFPELPVFDSEIGWLQQPEREDGITVGRLLLVDNHGLLASTVTRSSGTTQEQAVCGNGSSNGIVFLLRTLLEQQFDSSVTPRSSY